MMEVERSKKKKKDAKKKHKRDKKHKKSKEKHLPSSDSSTDSDVSASDEGNVGKTWVKKPAFPIQPQQKFETSQLHSIQRESWMTNSENENALFAGLIKTPRKEKEVKPPKEPANDVPGQHSRELNPYWKDGGCGLPASDTTPKKGQGVGDGGVSWLQRCYKRAEQQAEEQGKTIEEVATERWGSLDKFHDLLDAAKARNPQKSNQIGPACYRAPQMQTGWNNKHASDFFARSRSPGRRRSRSPGMSRSPGRWRSRSPGRRRSRSPGRIMSRSPGQNSSRSSGRRSSRSHGRRSSSPRRKGSRSPRRKRSRSPGRKRSRSPRRKRSWSPGRKRPRSPGDRICGGDLGASKFWRPGEQSSEQAHNTHSKRSSEQGWRKAEFVKSRELRDCSDHEKHEKVQKEEQKIEDVNSDQNSEKKDVLPSSEELPESSSLSEDELNKLGSKVLKAELMGNTELAAKLKAKLEAARGDAKFEPIYKKRQSGKERINEDVVLMRTSKTGMTQPVVAEESQPMRSRKRGKPTTHDKSGLRERYFKDDDRFTLGELVRLEKTTTSEDQMSQWHRMAGDGDDDVNTAKLGRQDVISSSDDRQRHLAIKEHRQQAAAVQNCRFCVESDMMKKHLIVSLGSKCYMALPAHKSLTDGHCYIVPVQHCTSSTLLDEDVWNEMQNYRKALVKMFEDDNDNDENDCVFMEMNVLLKQQRHMYLECVSVPREIGDMAPMYFKKAIQECDTEWSQNKKLVDLRGRSLRNVVPKGLPYFSVDFGMQSGFAHVIEDEHLFPHYFGREIVGGMMDLEPSLWRKPALEKFDEQSEKVLRFSEKFKPYEPKSQTC